MADFISLKSAITRRRFPFQGENKSEVLNDFVEETVHDFAAIFHFLNTSVIPAFNGLGKSGTFSDVDPIKNGIHGATIMTNKDSTEEPYYFDGAKNRTMTVYETFQRVVLDLNDIFADINSIQAQLGQTASSDEVATSAATLAEVETRVNALNQSVFQIQSANAAFATLSGIEAAITNKTINPTLHVTAGDVDSNAGIDPQDISGVDLTTSTSVPSSLPSNYDMQDTILRMKQWMEDQTGDTFLNYSGLNTTGPSLRDHLASSGTGVVSSGNVHGLDISDLSDSSNLLNTQAQIGEWILHPSGGDLLDIGSPSVTDYEGGYQFVNASYTVSDLAITLGIPGTTGKTVEVWRRRAGVNTLISGVSVSSTPTPGFTRVSPAGQSVQQDDMLFLSGISGDGLNARVFLYGTLA